MIKQTSIEAYKSISKEELGRRQRQILEAFEHYGDMNDKVLSRRIKRDINTVTPRRGELVKLGIVVEKGKQKCPLTGRTVTVWGLR